MLISICCTTYNHEQYIGNAIEGFLMQKTKFPFEIIIHDDASQDNTAKIIKKYANQFPNLIVPILQKENKYSKKEKVLQKYVLPKARGEYIALCEGDDYWTDPDKLQKQIDTMKKFPKCNFSFHQSCSKSLKTQKIKIINNYGKNNKIFYAKDAILGGGNFCPTASIIFKKDLLHQRPGFFLDVCVGDYPLQI